MSRIAFNGNALGTGTLTIASPNTNSDQTLTLPDSTGTVLLNGGAASFSTLTVNSNNISAVNSMGFRNRIINGDMRIDQRNAGASLTPTNEQYTLDRWQAWRSQASKYSVQQNAGSVTPPAGFSNYLGVTSLSAYSIAVSDYFMVSQKVEGFNASDFAWGTASAQAVTLSFWVRSSLTGTFGGSAQNSAQNRSYPFTYTISAANTWEQKTVSIAGDTSGIWLSTNGVGLYLWFGLGVGSNFSGTAGAWNANNNFSATGATSVVGTNGATWQITGVQLEAGSVATPFERRDYGRELMMCQRYYYKVITAAASAEVLATSGWNDSTTLAVCWTQFPVSMRTAPTAVEQTGTAANYQVRYAGGSTNCSSVPTFNVGSAWGARTLFTVASGLTAGQSVMAQTAATAGIYLAWSAEL